MRKISGKKVTSVIACVLLTCFLSSSAGIHMIQADEQSADTMLQQVAAVEESFTEEGTTSMGTVSQTLELTTNAVRMYVDEVYVEAGSTVAEGDALFKITEESLEAAKTYYISAIATAKDSLETAQLAYESGKLEAEYTKQDALLTAESATATLELALAELEEELDEKYGKWQGTVNNIIDCTADIENDTYYTEANVAQKQTAATQAESAQKAAQAEYNTANNEYKAALNQLESDILALENGGDSNSVVAAYRAWKTAEQTYNQKRENFENAKLNAQKASQEYEQAKQTYEKNLEQAKKSLEQMEENVDSLQTAYESASREAEIKRVTLQNEYETAVLEGEYAQVNYDATILELQSAVDKAQENLSDLEEAQAVLLSLENGVVCANQAGTLAAVNYEAGDILFSGATIVTYYDTSTITISLEIEQENIAKVAVKDEVSVSVSGNRRGTITGKVASIATSATTGRSVSDVTYTVIISIDNQKNELSAGSSATVVFGEKEERNENNEKEK